MLQYSDNIRDILEIGYTFLRTKRARFLRIRCGDTVHVKMVVLRCTRQLLMRLKYPDEDTSAESTTRLGDWYGTLIRFGRRHVLLFISEWSRLPVLLPARDADRLTLAFPKAVSEMLIALACVRVRSSKNAHRCRRSPSVVTVVCSAR